MDKKKLIKNTIVVLVLMIVLILGLMLYLNMMETKRLKLYIDGVATKFSSGLLLQNETTKEVQISIEGMAKLLKYDFYYGEYLGNNEDHNKCYVDNSKEVAAFYSDSSKIYKTSVVTTELDWGYFNLKDNVKMINGKLYTSLEGAGIGFNARFVYNSSDNSVNIQTLDYLVSRYSTSVISAGYTGISPEYNNQKTMLYGMIVAEKNKKFGVIRTDGSIIIGTKYDNISYIEDIKEFVVTNLNKVGIISETGETKINLEYDSIKLLDKDLGLWLVSSGGTYGVLDRQGQTVIYNEFKEIGLDKSLFPQDIIKSGLILFDNAIPVKRDEKWGMYNKNGRQILATAYDSIGCVVVTASKDNKSNLLLIPEINGIIVGRAGKYGIIDYTGKLILSCEYERIYFEMKNGRRDYYLKTETDTIRLDSLINMGEEEEASPDLDLEFDTNTTTNVVAPVEILTEENSVVNSTNRNYNANEERNSISDDTIITIE